MLKRTDIGQGGPWPSLCVEIRLPRTAFRGVIGGALGLSGASDAGTTCVSVGRPGIDRRVGSAALGAVWRSDGAGGQLPLWRLCPRWRLAVLYWVWLLVLLLAGPAGHRSLA